MKNKLLFLFLYCNITIYTFIMIIIIFCYKKNKASIVYTHINLSVISNYLIVFSCFYDKRYNSIRLIGISSQKVNFICKYFVREIYKLCDYKYVSLNKDSCGSNFKSLYTNILIYLQNSTIPKYILLDNKKYDVINDDKIVKKNVLCITTLKNFVSYELFIQSLKIYKHFGVTDVFIYTSDPNIYFEKFNCLIDTKIHVILIANEYHLNNSFYFGQTVKYNDCLYRNMYNSNYIIFTDFDELIVLNDFKSYYSFLNSLKEGDIFNFKSTICPTTNFVENKNFHLISDTHLNNTLNCCMMNSYFHRKYILKNLYKYIKINVHYVDYIYEKCKNVYVKENFGYIHHSRIPTYLLMNHCSKWFYDTSLKNLINLSNK